MDDSVLVVKPSKRRNNKIAFMDDTPVEMWLSPAEMYNSSEEEDEDEDYDDIREGNWRRSSDGVVSHVDLNKKENKKKSKRKKLALIVKSMFALHQFPLAKRKRARKIHSEESLQIINKKKILLLPSPPSPEFGSHHLPATSSHESTPRSRSLNHSPSISSNSARMCIDCDQHSRMQSPILDYSMSWNSPASPRAASVHGFSSPPAVHGLSSPPTVHGLSSPPPSGRRRRPPQPVNTAEIREPSTSFRTKVTGVNTMLMMGLAVLVLFGKACAIMYMVAWLVSVSAGGGRGTVAASARAPPRFIYINGER